MFLQFFLRGVVNIATIWRPKHKLGVEMYPVMSVHLICSDSPPVRLILQHAFRHAVKSKKISCTEKCDVYVLLMIHRKEDSIMVRLSFG